MDENKKTITAEEALDGVIRRLNSICVPVAAIKTIGVEITLAVDELNAIKAAVFRDEPKEEPPILEPVQPEEQTEEE